MPCDSSDTYIQGFEERGVHIVSHSFSKNVTAGVGFVEYDIREVGQTFRLILRQCRASQTHQKFSIIRDSSHC